MTEQHDAVEAAPYQEDIATLVSVLPTIGPYVSCSSFEAKGKSHRVFDSVEQLVESARALSARGHDVYFWIGTPINPDQTKTSESGAPYVQPRSQRNAKEIRALILDIDIKCGGPDRFHTSKENAVRELHQFCGVLDIPLPTIIDSGGGLHCYWPFASAIPALEWLTLAHHFKLTLQRIAPRLAADPTRIADSASLLRVPGTTNHKRGRPVRLIHRCKQALLAADYAKKLSDSKSNNKTTEVKPVIEALSCSVPVEIGPIESGCAWIKQYREQQAQASEPEWYATLGLVKHAQDGNRTAEDIAQSYSEGHTGYDAAATLKKLNHAREGQSGPTTCARFKALRPERCTDCPYAGRIVSPIQISSAVPPEVPDRVSPNENIDAAFARLGNDAGALYEATVLSSLRHLRASSPADFARIRARAKDSKLVTMAEFDRLTLPDDEDEGASDHTLFPYIEPWPKPVDGAELFNEIAATLAMYVIADAATVYAATLWIAHTWLIDGLTVTPIANITAPEKRCGKSVLLDLLRHLSNKPLQTTNISPAALYRSVEKWSPTLLIDEVDSFLRTSDETRGIINSGFTRAMAYVIRCVGDDSEPQRFSTWGAKALAGIGSLPDTIADRSIPFRLRRKMSSETVSNLRHADPVQWEQFRARLKRWADDFCSAVIAARPQRLEGLNDRANDCWEPLFAIADAAGGDWPKRAREAALEIHSSEDDTQSKGVELLANIKSIFERRQATNILNADLLNALVEDPEWRWGTWNHGKPMTQRQLTALLKSFNVNNHSVRTERNSGRGYSRSDFEDAFVRYLPETLGTSAQA